MTTRLDQIRSDILQLAGRFAHRGAQTEEERHAAEFIRGRFLEYTQDADLDEFHCIDNYHLLFASYYSEFLLVSVLAWWWPAVAACYGLGVMTMYLAEFMGHRAFSRFMPQYDSQNVVARFPAAVPKHLVIVTAHYDSGAASPLTNPSVLPWLRPLHFLLLACMAAVIATCAVDAWGALDGTHFPYLAPVRWIAVSVLLVSALVLFFDAPNSEDVRGANNNASGVAALLSLAERFANKPLDEVDVWLIAVGSHESWMSGMRHLIEGQELPIPFTYFLNIESVGAGNLHYLKNEGMLHCLPSGRRLRSVAERTAAGFHAAPADLRALPTGAHVPLSRGYEALTVMGLDESGMPAHWNWHTDSLSAVDESAIAKAADFTEALVRGLAKDLATASVGQPET